MNQGEVAKVYAALLSSPGMNESVKIDLKISRKTVLLLNQVIERGMNGKPDEGSYGVIEALGKEELEGVKDLAKDCLDKAGLADLSSKLSVLSGGK